MPRTQLPYRQVHLDFHTSMHCQDLGIAFSEAEFADTLTKAKVQSINIFACCHHGWCYYPNACHDLTHPNLKTDLLGRMIDACHGAGIRAVAYITVGWNNLAATRHPEWCVRTADGNYMDYPGEKHPDSPRPWGWKRMCLNTDYLQQVLDVTRDVLEHYKPDGFFFDITGETLCHCHKCLADMRAMGLDPANPEHHTMFSLKVYKRYLKAIQDLIHGYDPKLTIYHNGSSIRTRHDIYPYDTHIEIESLPTGGWGYDHFPQGARYFKMLKDWQVIGMTGKFHTEWGEFGGFKNPDALRYECAQIASLGCLVNVGDQLHPNGRLDPETYRIIGAAFSDLEARQEWLEDAEILADVAILGTMEMFNSPLGEQALTGASKILMEAHIPHTVIDETMDFTPYRLIVLPDQGRLDNGVRDKLNRFLAFGGSLLLSYESGVAKTSWEFALDVGATCKGPSSNDVEYIEAGDAVAANLVRSPFLAYESGMTSEVVDAEVLASTWKPMFNRTYAHFTSHRNTPPECRVPSPAAIRKGSVVYLSHPLFRLYNSKGMKLHRDLVVNCLNMLYTNKLATAELPSCGRLNLTRQPAKNRILIHLLYATPIKRGSVEVIEDIVPLHDVPVTLAVPSKPKAVMAVPEQTELPYTYADGRIRFTLPKLTMAQIVAVEL